MKYALFYNYPLFGDVLLVQFAVNCRATHSQDFPEVSVIYSEDKIIGYNIFNLQEIVKIRSLGLIALPPNPLIDIINLKLTSLGLMTLPYMSESGFTVGQIISLKDHPDSDHLHVVQVDVKDKILDVVCGAPNVALGQKVVVAMPYTTMPNGMVIVHGELRGIKSEAMLCSAHELNLEGASPKRGILILDEKEVVGSDFFERI